MNIDWASISANLVQLLFAYLLALPIGWNREMNDRSAGLRTFPLVAVATCGYMLIGIQVLESTEAEGRVMVGVLTGMGFIGGGAILKDQAGISGTATAASLWNTGAIGLAVAWQRYEIAILLMLLNFLALQFFSPVKTKMKDQGKSIQI